jgi:hypothetical protein
MSVTSSAFPERPQADGATRVYAETGSETAKRCERRKGTAVFGTRLNLVAGRAAVNGYGAVAGPRRRRGAGRAEGNGALRGVFPIWQPRYAAHGIATFPVRIVAKDDGKFDKMPATRGYLRTGVRGSAQLALKFPRADALGIVCGQPNKLVVLDVDTTDDRVLADAQSRHGPTPLIVRTASRKFHGYYKHNGERRWIRPYPGQPIDILGGGFVVAPPSRAGNGQYEIIQGTLDDLDRLPVMRGLDNLRGVATSPRAEPSVCAREEEPEPSPLRGMREHDGRNRAQFMTIGPIARDIHRACGSREDLLRAAIEHNAQAEQPMEDGEVEGIVNNVWKMTLESRNAIGLPGLFCLSVEHLELDSDVLKLLAFLRAHQGPHATFWCSNGLADTFGWG